MTETQSWRDLLSRIIQDPQERQRIAKELKLNPVTLTRWANNVSKPRMQNLRQLCNAIPSAYQDSFIAALPEDARKAFKDPDTIDAEDIKIPALFYSRLLDAHCHLPAVLRFSSLCDMILQEAIKHLDPHRFGLELTVVKCMLRPSDEKVRSAREVTGRGTPPWDHELEHRTTFLGVESLAGYVISTGLPRVIADRAEGSRLFPVVWDVHEQSSMAHPIIVGNTIAGCLLGSSSRRGFFLPMQRQILFSAYAELLNLIFLPDDYRPLESIELAYMPPYKQQRQYMAHFRDRVSRLMVQKRLRVQQAEQQVWQEIEEELLKCQVK